MTRTAEPARPDVHVLIVGGGVAGLEAALALRALAPERIGVEVVAPELHFYYRPLAVAEAFGGPRVRRWELADLARSGGFDFTLGMVERLDPEGHAVHLRQGPPIFYDMAVLAYGVRSDPAVPGAFTFRGPADVEAFARLLDEVEEGAVERLLFAVPTGTVWPLPLYELALLTAARLRERELGAEVVFVTSEPAPLALFGRWASDAVRAALEEAGVEIHVSTYAVEATGEGLATVRGGTLPAGRVVSLPRLSAPEIGGVPRDRAGFVPVDAHGRVLGLEDVYAAGDLTTFPVKQGGLATQQADAVAEAVAAAAGEAIEPTPFRPVLRALLLTARGARYLRVEPTGGRGESSEASEEPLWWPPGKIVGRHLAPFLADLGILDATPGPEPDVLEIEIEEAALHLLNWPR
ncbi:MAG TPA: FAD-dependent oxidoreductase [Gaiellaceae bacterium]|nr:FAD-dependent oxidoreductase [Gaiellaceae bacterium]